MTLVQGYSSDEEDNIASSSKDVFGLSSIPSVKKLRLDEDVASTATNLMVDTSAPHVLAEVHLFVSMHTLFRRLTCQ